MWSCGVIMHVILCGEPPWTKFSWKDGSAAAKKRGISFEQREWEAISPEAKDLVSKLIQVDPKKRLTTEEALSAVWIAKHAPRASDLPLSQSCLDNLEKFRSANILKRAALLIIAQQMGDADIKALREKFTALDRNGDGQLTFSEMKEGIQKSGLEVPPDLSMLMRQLDFCGSGVVDYTEFIAATLDKKAYMEEETLWGAFRVFDKGGKGSISEKDLRKLLSRPEVRKSVNLEDSFSPISKVMAEVDADGNGEIDFEEFMFMMRTSPKKRTSPFKPRVGGS